MTQSMMILHKKLASFGLFLACISSGWAATPETPPAPPCSVLDKLAKSSYDRWRKYMESMDYGSAIVAREGVGDIKNAGPNCPTTVALWNKIVEIQSSTSSFLYFQSRPLKFQYKPGVSTYQGSVWPDSPSSKAEFFPQIDPTKSLIFGTKDLDQLVGKKDSSGKLLVLPVEEQQTYADVVEKMKVWQQAGAQTKTPLFLSEKEYKTMANLYLQFQAKQTEAGKTKKTE